MTHDDTSVPHLKACYFLTQISQHQSCLSAQGGHVVQRLSTASVHARFLQEMGAVLRQLQPPCTGAGELSAKDVRFFSKQVSEFNVAHPPVEGQLIIQLLNIFTTAVPS